VNPPERPIASAALRTGAARRPEAWLGTYGIASILFT
jgi:hypothetical protein